MPQKRNKSKQYLFKNKPNKRLKSKRELINESFFMMIVGLFLLLINYLIPQKIELFRSFNKNLLNILSNIIEIVIYSFDILIVLLICFSFLISIFFISGSINRLLKVMLQRSRKVRFR